MRIKNKVAVVTGAAGYIGREVAIRLAEEGAKVTVNDIDRNKMDKVVKEINKIGQEAIAIEADITKKSQVQNMMDETVKRFGKLDILVNVPGGHRFGLVTEVPEENWNYEIDLNLKGSFNCIQAAAKYMKNKSMGKS